MRPFKHWLARDELTGLWQLTIWKDGRLTKKTLAATCAIDALAEADAEIRAYSYQVNAPGVLLDELA